MAGVDDDESGLSLSGQDARENHELTRCGVPTEVVDVSRKHLRHHLQRNEKLMIPLDRRRSEWLDLTSDRRRSDAHFEAEGDARNDNAIVARRIRCDADRQKGTERRRTHHRTGGIRDDGHMLGSACGSDGDACGARGRRCRCHLQRKEQRNQHRVTVIGWPVPFRARHRVGALSRACREASFPCPVPASPWPLPSGSTTRAE